MVIDKDRLHPNMPKKVTKAKIALLNAAVLNTCPPVLKRTARADRSDARSRYFKFPQNRWIRRQASSRSPVLTA